VKGGPWPELQNSLVWVDHQGNDRTITSLTAPFHVPRLSPDGQTLAFTCLSGDYPTYIYDLARGTSARLLGEGKRNCGIWTADGQRLIFGWWALGYPHLAWQTADGSAPAENLTAGEYVQWPGSVTPDGTTLAYVEERPDTSSDIYLMRFADRAPVAFLNSRFAEQYPSFSPDGRFVAYSSNEGGLLEVYVRSYPGPGGRWKISLDYATEPLWSRDGKRLFYRSGTQVWMVDVRTDTGFEHSRPRLLFDKPGYSWSMPTRCWDISLDGRSFLMVKFDPRRDAPATEMIIVKNWFEELKRIVPKPKG
jgi:serine/threonine-protein kinase